MGELGEWVNWVNGERQKPFSEIENSDYREAFKELGNG
jgi:hypothetical protein